MSDATPKRCPSCERTLDVSDEASMASLAMCAWCAECSAPRREQAGEPTVALLIGSGVGQ